MCPTTPLAAELLSDDLNRLVFVETLIQHVRRNPVTLVAAGASHDQHVAGSQVVDPDGKLESENDGFVWHPVR